MVWCSFLQQPGLLAAVLIPALLDSIIGKSAHAPIVLELFGLGLGLGLGLILSRDLWSGQSPLPSAAGRKQDKTFRDFIQHSSDGICRLELSAPLPTELPETRQIDHLLQYGFVTECNLKFAQTCGYAIVEDLIGQPLSTLLDGSNPTHREFLGAFIQSGYHLLDVEFCWGNYAYLPGDFLTRLIGAVENGQLRVLWGTQQDITEMKRRTSDSHEQRYRQVQEFTANLERQVQQRTAQLQLASEFETTLKRITDKVRDSLDEAQILQTVVQELGTGMGVNSCNAAIYDQEAGTSTICYEYNPPIVPLQGLQSRLANYPEIYNQLLAGECFQFCFLRPNPVRGRTAILACPIIDDQKVLGDLWLIADRDYGFKDLEVRLVQQVANQSAIALRQSRLYQAAQEQVLELERLNRLKDDFLSSVSHELRTPMSNMKIAIRMLEIQLKPLEVFQAKASPLQRYIKVLREECDREITLINTLLDLSRLDAGMGSLTLNTVTNLSTWVLRLIEPFRDRVQVQQQRLEVAIAADLPPLTTDLSLLESILLELLNNACKYTPTAETISISIQAVQHPAESSTEPRLCQISITNSGVEIAAAEQPYLFDKFYRVPGLDPWKYSGTGLGLALVKRQVEQLGGQIELTSQNKTTTFIVEIPWNLAPPAQPSLAPSGDR